MKRFAMWSLRFGPMIRVWRSLGVGALPLLLCLSPWMGDASADATSPVVGHLVDSVALRGVEDVHLAGDLAYLPCREGQRLSVCSIEDPANPRLVSSFTHDELGPAAGFDLHDGIAYVSSQSNGRLLVLDVSDPTAIQWLGSVTIGDGALYKVAYRDGYCYVAHQGGKAIVVVDVHDPRNPLVVESLPVTTGKDGPFSVTLTGNFALVGTIFGTENRLSVLSIEDPARPRPVGELLGPVVGHASGEIVDGLFIAVNWAANALLVIDLADMTQPRLVASLVDPRLGAPNRCVVADDRAYLPMVEGHGIAVVDISDPRAPGFLGAYQSPMLQKTYGVAVRGPLLVVGAREGNSLVLLSREALE